MNRTKLSRCAQINLASIDDSFRQLFIFLCALTVYIGIFAGRFSFSRILPKIFSQWFLLEEVRTWAVLLGAILAVVGWCFYRSAENLSNKTQVWRCVGFVVLVQVAVIIHTLLYKGSEVSAYFLWELFAVIFVSLILGAYYRIWGVQLINKIMWVALLSAVTLSAWFWCALMYSNTAINENPIGSTFTLYRIQIFGGFAGIFIYFRIKKDRTVRAALMLCSLLCFSCAFLTLSKAALLVGTAGLLLLAAIYVTWFERLKAVAVLTVYAVAITLFAVVSGGSFTARVSEGVLGAGYALNLQEITPLSREEIVVSIDGTPSRGPCLGVTSDDCMVELVRAEFEAQRKVADVLACTAGGYVCGFRVERWEQDIADTMLRFRVYIPDFSFRIRLLMHGLDGVSRAPWLGNGFGSFHMAAVNLYTKDIDHYFYPHNFLVEALYAVGVLGSLFISAMLLLLFWELLRNKDKIQSCLPIFASVVSIGLGSLFGGDYLDFRLVWMGLLLCIMCCEKPESGELSLIEVAK